jgi:hypothetical protein
MMSNLKGRFETRILMILQKVWIFVFRHSGEPRIEVRGRRRNPVFSNGYKDPGLRFSPDDFLRDHQYRNSKKKFKKHDPQAEVAKDSRCQF